MENGRIDFMLDAGAAVDLPLGGAALAPGFRPPKSINPIAAYSIEFYDFFFVSKSFGLEFVADLLFRAEEIVPNGDGKSFHWVAPSVVSWAEIETSAISIIIIRII